MIDLIELVIKLIMIGLLAYAHLWLFLKSSVWLMKHFNKVID